jgi:hypothetical protein
MNDNDFHFTEEQKIIFSKFPNGNQGKDLWVGTWIASTCP